MKKDLSAPSCWCFVETLNILKDMIYNFYNFKTNTIFFQDSPRSKESHESVITVKTKIWKNVIRIRLRSLCSYTFLRKIFLIFFNFSASRGFSVRIEGATKLSMFLKSEIFGSFLQFFFFGWVSFDILNKPREILVFGWWVAREILVFGWWVGGSN